MGFDEKLEGIRPFAIIQLRRENVAGSAFNLVGFQTKMTREAQKNLFRKFSALQKAEFLRYGSIHKNSYIKSPELLNKDFSLKGCKNIFFAGQLTGGEGYVESVASGLYSAIQIANKLGVTNYQPLPEYTMVENIMKYVINPINGKNFKPMGVNFGLLPPIPGKISRRERYEQYAERSLGALKTWLEISAFQK